MEAEALREAQAAKSKEERIELLRRQTLRRVMHRDLALGWNAWSELWRARSQAKKPAAKATPPPPKKKSAPTPVPDRRDRASRSAEKRKAPPAAEEPPAKKAAPAKPAPAAKPAAKAKAAASAKSPKPSKPVADASSARQQTDSGGGRR